MKNIVVLCREVDKFSNREVLVYKIDKEITERDIHLLRLRSRINPELKYFAMLNKIYSRDKEHIETLLKSKNYEYRIKLYGGIEEL